jgi:hypothetical protein
MKTLAEDKICNPSEVRKRWAPIEPTVVFDTYWRFAAERQRIFMERAMGRPAPWTEDPILRAYKFTNAYRATDRVSQFLIREVIYAGDPIPEEVVFRILLFKLFNKIQTWQLLCSELGKLSLRSFSPKAYDKVLSSALNSKRSIYSAAYIMPSGASQLGYERKHRNHLALLERMMSDGISAKLRRCSRMSDAFDLLRSYPTIGDFLAYQFVTDINYSEVTDYSEMEFVVPGPGSKSGIRKCFYTLGGLTEEEVIYLVAKRQEEEFNRLGLHFERLGDRRLQLIDCQNLFCETDKYARIAHPEVSGIGSRIRIKQQFRAHPEPVRYMYPPKWGIKSLFSDKSLHFEAAQRQFKF